MAQQPAHHVLWGWNRFFEEMGSFIRDLNRRTGDASETYCEYALDRLEICIGSLSALVELLKSRPASVSGEGARIAAHYSSQITDLLQCLQKLYLQWDGYTEGQVGTSVTSFSAPLSRSGHRGRPAFVISKEQIQYLRSMSFSWVQIAKLLGVSYMTLYRRRQDFGMSSNVGASISDQELRSVLDQLRRELPSLGQTMVWGRLRAMGFEVTRIRVRQVMRESDPIHTALRWKGEFVQRRPYSVAGPNSLWHLGENNEVSIP